MRFVGPMVGDAPSDVDEIGKNESYYFAGQYTTCLRCITRRSPQRPRDVH